MDGFLQAALDTFTKQPLTTGANGMDPALPTRVTIGVEGEQSCRSLVLVWI